jgi:hypothetical protein
MYQPGRHDWHPKPAHFRFDQGTARLPAALENDIQRLFEPLIGLGFRGLIVAIDRPGSRIIMICHIVDAEIDKIGRQTAPDFNHERLAVMANGASPSNSLHNRLSVASEHP